jgi:hypothetical protein
VKTSISGSILAGFGLLGKIAVEYLTAQGANPSMIVSGLSWLFLATGVSLMIYEFREELT